MSQLARYYGLHISDETNGTSYSSTFCSRRYIRLVKLNNSTHPSEGVLKSANDQIEYANRVWTPLDSTVCLAVKGGRPVKPGRGPKTPHAQIKVFVTVVVKSVTVAFLVVFSHKLSQHIMSENG